MSKDTSTHSDFVKNNEFITTQNISTIAFNKPLKKRKTADYDLFICQNNNIFLVYFIININQHIAS